MQRTNAMLQVSSSGLQSNFSIVFPQALLLLLLLLLSILLLINVHLKEQFINLVCQQKVGC